MGEAAEVVETQDEPAEQAEQVEAEQTEKQEGETPTEPEAEAAEESAEEVVISIGDEAPPEEEERGAPQWVKDLRKSDREKTRKLREYEAEIQRLKAPSVPAAVVVGERPKLADFDFDEDRYDTALTSWMERKSQAEEAQRTKQRQEEEAREAWNSKLASYGKAKAALKVPDYEEAEAQVLETLSVVQQGVILKGSKRPELMVYALGKNPKKMKELAAIADPIDFAFAAAELGMQLKVTPRNKTAPAPEVAVRGSMPAAAAAVISKDGLEKMRVKAQESGDYTAYFAAKRKMEAKAS